MTKKFSLYPMKNIIKNSILLFAIATIYSCSKNQAAEKFSLHLIPSDKVNEANVYFSFPKNTNLENIYFEFSGDAMWEYTKASGKLIEKDTLIRVNDLAKAEPGKNFLSFTITRLVDNKELTLNLKDKDGKEIQTHIKTTAKIKGNGNPRVSIESINFPKGQTTGEIVVLFENGAEKAVYNHAELYFSNSADEAKYPPIFLNSKKTFEIQVNNDPAKVGKIKSGDNIDLRACLTTEPTAQIKLTLKGISPNDEAIGNIRLDANSAEHNPKYSELYMTQTIIVEKK
jgi:hypothetical protein